MMHIAQIIKKWRDNIQTTSNQETNIALPKIVEILNRYENDREEVRKKLPEFIRQMAEVVAPEKTTATTATIATTATTATKTTASLMEGTAGAGVARPQTKESESNTRKAEEQKSSKTPSAKPKPAATASVNVPASVPPVSKPSADPWDFESSDFIQGVFEKNQGKDISIVEQRMEVQYVAEQSAQDWEGQTQDEELDEEEDEEDVKEEIPEEENLTLENLLKTISGKPGKSDRSHNHKDIRRQKRRNKKPRRKDRSNGRGKDNGSSRDDNRRHMKW